jgi:transposase
VVTTPKTIPPAPKTEAGRYFHRLSASIEVSRRGKNAKTDRLDVEKLLTMLLRYHAGESRVWSVVHVPSLAAEDQRHLHRQLLALKGERTRYVNRQDLDIAQPTRAR